MLETNTTTDTTKNNGISTIIEHDRELNGELNRALEQGAKFGLLMAMLEQNSLDRPIFDNPNQTLDTYQAPATQNFYPNQPLHAQPEDWQQLHQTRLLMDSGQTRTAQLWLAMHPEPLSQHDNPLKISDDVLANCCLTTQNRLKEQKTHRIEIDETGLFDILQGMDTEKKVA